MRIETRTMLDEHAKSVNMSASRLTQTACIVEQQTGSRPPALDGVYEREGEKSLEILVTRLCVHE